MSVYTMARVWRYSRARGTDRLVLLAIADNANDEGEDAFPKVATIAHKAGVSERTVQRAVLALVELGELVVAFNAGAPNVTRPDRRPNAYRVTVGPTGRQSDTSRGVNGSPRRGVNVSPPIEEPSEGQPSVEPSGSSTPLSTVPVDDDFDPFWQAFPRRNGKRIGRRDAERGWRRLKPEERAAALVGARHYAEACEGGLTIAADAHRWLAKRRWLDWQEPARPDRRPPAGRPSTMAVGLQILDEMRREGQDETR